MWRAGLQRHNVEEAVVCPIVGLSFLPLGSWGARGICQGYTKVLSSSKGLHTCPPTLARASRASPSPCEGILGSVSAVLMAAVG